VSSPRAGLSPLPPKLQKLTDDPAFIPAGYGFRPLGVGELLERAKLGELLEVFQQYEPPLRGHRYVVSADVSDGLGKDRSSVDVIRLGTLDRVEEQVAHFISDRVKPRELAFVIDAVGHLYCDDDGLEALAAVETNNHGLSTQDTLQLHLGYTHFYRWEYLDSMDPSSRFTNRVGWYTTARTRPMLLDHFHEALTTFDPVTGLPDLRVNSPWTLGELADFQTDGALWEACAAAGAFDDCILSLSIGHYVAWRLVGGEREPLADRRRRRHQKEQRSTRLDSDREAGRDYRNMPYTEAEVAQAEVGQAVDEESELEELYDVRGVEYDDLSR
jgi:hypothetical protein